MCLDFYVQYSEMHIIQENVLNMQYKTTEVWIRRVLNRAKFSFIYSFNCCLFNDIMKLSDSVVCDSELVRMWKEVVVA